MSSSSNVVCIYTAAWTSFRNWGLNDPISIETKRVFNGPNFVEDEKGWGLVLQWQIKLRYDPVVWEIKTFF